MAFLIDTCIWIDVERGSISPSDVANYTGGDSVYISPVTITELTFGAEMATDERIRQKRIVSLRTRPKITSHFRISSSCYLRPILIRKILEIVLLFLWFRGIGSSKSNTNLSANSVKLFLGEPLIG